MQEHTVIGLTDQQAEQSRREHGSNRLTARKKDGFFKQLLANLGDPIIKVLLIALALNLLFLFRSHDWFEAFGIAIAVFLATLVSTVSEYGSEAAFERLQQESDGICCRVYRNGHLCSLPLEELVVGDIVSLQSGERIPADGVMISGKLQVDQSALNGESEEMEKRAATETEPPSLSSLSYVFRGSVITAGNGCMQISQVGDHTLYGGVADALQEETRESPLKLRLAGLAQTISRIGFVAAAVIGFADLFYSIVVVNGYQWDRIVSAVSCTPDTVNLVLHALTLAITVLVVAVPEGLPMMITVVLSSNMKRMLSHHVLVRKLVGIETAGSITMLFTDKTGTLTEGKPKVSLFVSADNTSYHSAAALRSDKPLWKYVRYACLYNTESTVSEGKILGGNATDRALLSYVYDRHPFPSNIRVHEQIAFDSSRKWSGTEIEMKSHRRILSLYKGAPDRLLSRCDRYMKSDGTLSPLDTSPQKIVSMLEEKAMRVLLLAVSDSPLSTDPQHLILLGFAGLRDDVRPEVRRAVLSVKTAGIQPVMVTGDSKETATVIARAAGFFKNRSEEIDSILTGDELAALSDEQLAKQLPHLAVVARALPGDKIRLVRIAQECGYVVGMTGDGVNDAPALKKADVSFAMGSGTEVAKQAGDIVILDDNFASIAKAILFGRTIFKSIRKFIIFQLTMNFCAVGISLIGPFIGIEAPVTVTQMLWVNMIMDTLAGLAFAGEPPLMEYMEEKPKKRDEPILNRYMLSQILLTGLFTIGLCILFLTVGWIKPLFRYTCQPIYWMTAFFTLFIFSGICNSFNARTTRLNLLSHLRSNPAFVLIMTAVTVIQLLLVRFGGDLFRSAPLTPRELVVVFLLSALVIPFDMLRKCILRLCHRHGTV